MYESKLVRLRALNAEDAERSIKWLNDAETARNVRGGGAMPLNLEEERQWISANAGGNKDGECHFAIETLDGVHIGVCSYNSVNWRNGVCYVGWFIGEPEMRGKGYGSDMIRLLLSICFNELDMRKVKLKVFSYNGRAVRLYERLGFVREGTLREEVYAMGRRWDEYIYAMLRPEYEALCGKI